MSIIQTLKTKDSESNFLKQTLSSFPFLSLWLSGLNRTHTVTLELGLDILAFKWGAKSPKSGWRSNEMAA
jgi:hypothetical protein